MKSFFLFILIISSTFILLHCKKDKDNFFVTGLYTGTFTDSSLINDTIRYASRTFTIDVIESDKAHIKMSVNRDSEYLGTSEFQVSNSSVSGTLFAKEVHGNPPDGTIYGDVILNGIITKKEGKDIITGTHTTTYIIIHNNVGDTIPMKGDFVIEPN